MARPRDPNREKAFEMYSKNQGNIDLVEIASQLNISPGTVRGWKSKDTWEQKVNGTLRNDLERFKRKKGGQPGNKNATGGPPGNKKAVKTGEFEALFFDVLDPDEVKLASSIQLDREQLLLQEIQLLTVRGRRMLQRIEQLRHPIEYPDQEIPKGMTVTKFGYGLQRGEPTALKEYVDSIDRVQAIEEALTRVQAKKQKAIEALHRFRYDDARLELETLKFEMAMLKQGDQGEETGDDGFLEAMNASAADVWGDADDE